MAVPGHDELDFEFAKKYGLEIREVISPDGSEHATHLERDAACARHRVRSERSRTVTPVDDAPNERSEPGAIATGLMCNGVSSGSPDSPHRLTTTRSLSLPALIFHCVPLLSRSADKR